jgi:hypothetical protein
MEAAERLTLRERRDRTGVDDCLAMTMIVALMLRLMVLGDVAIWHAAHDLAPRERNL